MSAVILGVAFATSLATLLGGLAALRFRRMLHLILAFSAGTAIALAFFDLLPEALRLGGDANVTDRTLAVAAAGFFSYAILDRLLLLNGGVDDATAQRGWAGAGGLSAHSFVDGLALGIGFQASTSIGIVIAVAILAHDCSDGMNTVSVILRNRGTRRVALFWLVVDALAPLAGAAASLFFHPSHQELALVLAGFAGFFLYIGSSDLLPESFRTGSRLATTLALLTGAAALYGVVRIAG